MENFNQLIFKWIFQFSHRNFVSDWFGIFLSQYLPYLLVLGFLFLVFSQPDWRKRVFIFAEGALAVIIARGIITEFIRFFYHHPRPFETLGFTPLVGESGYSFPSGHAAFFFTLAIVVFYFNRKMGIWYFVLSAVSVIARIFVGVHWPIDVLGGVLIGLLVGYLTHRALAPRFKEIISSSEKAVSV